MSLTIPLAMVADMVVHGRHYSAIYILGSAQVIHYLDKGKEEKKNSLQNHCFWCSNDKSDFDIVVWGRFLQDS